MNDFLNNGKVLVASAVLFLVCLRLLTRTSLAAGFREKRPRAYFLTVLLLMFCGVLFLVRGARVAFIQ